MELLLYIFMAPYVVAIILGFFTLVWEAMNMPTTEERIDDE